MTPDAVDKRLPFSCTEPHSAPDGAASLVRDLSRDDGVEPEEDDGWYADVVDPHTSAVRLCAHRCDTCIFHPGNLMHLQPGRVADMVAWARESQGHVVCHKTLGIGAPAICRGFADGPDQGRGLALRLARALGTLHEIRPP